MVQGSAYFSALLYQPYSMCACAYNSVVTVVHIRPLLFHAVSGIYARADARSCSSLFAEVARVDLQRTWMVVERVALHSSAARFLLRTTVDSLTPGHYWGVK